MAKGVRLPGGAPEREIRIEFEGEAIPAKEGEPLAVSLLAAGVEVFSRAVKYHRARGPYCLSGRCAHCVMRVDGEPNVTTCTVPARDGMKVERQNAFPSAEHDIFRTIDWFYPRGLDHHTLFAGVPVVERVVAKVARQMAGLGQLPEEAHRGGASYLEHETEVLVIGGGSAGIAAARAAAASGAKVTLIDEQKEIWGRLRTGLYGAEPAESDRTSSNARLGSRAAGPAVSRASDTLDAPGDLEGAKSPSPAQYLEHAGVHLLSRTFAFAIYREEGLLVAAKAPGRRLLVVRPKAVVLATGATELLAPFGNNDLPGVFAGRALARLITQDRLLPGRRFVVAGDGPERAKVSALLREAGAEVIAEVGLRPGAGPHLVRARGRSAVAGVVIQEAGGKEQRLRCDAVAVTDETSAFLDLARHAGARVEWKDTGFAVEVDERFFTGAAQIFACGEVVGPASPAQSAEQGAIAGAGAAKLARQGALQ